MARLPILEYPDPRLRTRARAVTEFDTALSRLVDDMLDTMYAARGIGLAATQVDVHRQVVVIDVSGERNEPQVFINPEVLWRDVIGLVEESCLSVPGISDRVERATQLRVRYLERCGTPCERDLGGLLAVCLQHEMDHLAGTLFTDRLPYFRRLRARLQLRRDRQARHERSRADVA
jgi:peptide deformylase